MRVLAFLNSSASLEIDSVATSLPTSFVWMPVGTHAICAGSLSGEPWEGTVKCDAQGAANVQRDLAQSLKAGHRVWIDFNHADADAAGWVSSFSWDPAKGIICHVEWTKGGEEALRAKSYYSFSPAFLVDRESGRVAGLVAGHAAGGLVNAPAFRSMPALIAARLSGEISTTSAPGGTPVTQEKTNTMSEVIAPVAAVTAAAITPAPVPAVPNQSADLSALTTQLTALVAALKPAAPVAPVAPVAVAAAAPVVAPVIVAPGVSEIEHRPHVSVTASIEDTFKGYAKFELKDGKGKGEFYDQNVAPVLAKIGGRKFSELLLKAIPVLAKNEDVRAANSLGTLSGTLVAQQALALLTYEFPILGMLSSDFSDQSAKWNQTIQTRLKTAIAASQYTTTYTAANATTTDVPVVINHHPYAQVAFNTNELASSSRDLFGEQAEVVNYALGLDMVNAIYALFVAANYTITPLVLGGTGGGTAGASGVGYARASAVNAAKALFVNLQPRSGRWNLLNANAFGGLGSDAAVVSMASYLKPEIITGYQLPPIADMQPIQVVNLPTTLNLCGVAGSPRAIAIATRVPNDYTQALPGASYGNVSQVTDPKTGITFVVTQYVNHDTGTANYRVAVMYGLAVGDPKGAVLTYGA